jgi:hypothetical protein
MKPAKKIGLAFFWLIAPAMLLCGAAWYAGAAQWAPSYPGGGSSARIYAYKGWQSTGLFLQAGESYTLRARGAWQYTPLIKASGPQGVYRAAPETYPLPEVWAGALLARIGEDGAPFAVGSAVSGRAEAGGMLYLRINDDLLGDNQGAMEVTWLTAPTPMPAGFDELGDR